MARLKRVFCPWSQGYSTSRGSFAQNRQLSTWYCFQPITCDGRTPPKMWLAMSPDSLPKLDQQAMQPNPQEGEEIEMLFQGSKSTTNHYLYGSGSLVSKMQITQHLSGI